MQNDCLDNMDCIRCSACHVWLHFSCTKLTEHEFRNKTYFFCSKKCENSVVFPDYSESEHTVENNTTVKPPKKKRKKPNLSENFILTDHFLDINCSYFEPNLIDSSYLKNNDFEITLFHNNVRSLNKNFHLVQEIFQN